MKTMQNEVTKNETLPKVSKTVFFYGEGKTFIDDATKIAGEFYTGGKLIVKIHLKKGEYLLYSEIPQRQMFTFVRQLDNNHPLYLDDPKWHRSLINSSKDIPSIYSDLCYYDEENECLTISLSVCNDYAIDYGTYPWANSIYLQFQTGHHWRFIDRVTGG
jgi:hypothetical protein